MQAMDYRLTDDVADPPGLTEGWHTERLWRMPGRFFTYLPPIDAPPVRSRLASAGDALTFGSFNNFMKITPQVLSAWRRILERVPRSRLVVLTFSSAATSDQVRAALGVAGLDADRVQLVDRLPYREYLELIGSASIALDTFPFNGHTTVCDSLWMGTPVITLAGDHYASRYGGCALESLGLGDLIAHDVESYIESAVALATDRPQLARLQATLRERMRASVLLDAVGFTRELEAAYRQMWHRWCASEGTS
jgi:predicted O-linked N-acetylglucosamine transferase (SPINDLY family)